MEEKGDEKEAKENKRETRIGKKEKKERFPFSVKRRNEAQVGR